MIKAGSMRIEMGETGLDVIDKLNPLLDRFGLVLQATAPVRPRHP